MRLQNWLSLLASSALATASLIQPRDLCAKVDADLEILGIIFGKIDVCLWYVFIINCVQTKAASLSTAFDLCLVLMITDYDISSPITVSVELMVRKLYLHVE